MSESVHVDRTAPVIVEDEIIVAAPRDTVWSLHTGISAWPTWRGDVDRAELDGPFAVGATFHWSTGGLDIDSTISEVQDHQRTAWGGPAAGIMGIHVWEFTQQGDGTRVHTTESWAGPAIEGKADQARTMLAGSIAAWLSDLKKAAESAG